jgi:hypothetical protein
MMSTSIREILLAAGVMCALVAWFLDRQVLHDTLQVATSIIAAARER